MIEIGKVYFYRVITFDFRILIHGWGSDIESFFLVDGTAAYLESSDLNVIWFVVDCLLSNFPMIFVSKSVDWSLGAQTINYVAAKNRVEPVGRLLGDFIDFLHENNAMRFEDLIVVGYSLGAHLAGFSGKGARRGRISTIIGLDPANPL